MSTTEKAQIYRFRATSWFNYLTFEQGWTVCGSPKKGRPYNIPVGREGEILKFDTEQEAKEYANKLNAEL